MEERRRCSTVEQLETLIGFLEQHRELALGRIRTKEARAASARLWGECAELVNREGPARTAKEWAKMWNDYKCRVRAKLVTFNANVQGTGGGPGIGVQLTPLEDRVATILGRDVGPLPNIKLCPLDAGNDMEPVALEEGTVEQVVVVHEVDIQILNEEDVKPPITAAASPVPSHSGQTPTRGQRRKRSTISQLRSTERRARNSSRPSTRAPYAQPRWSAVDEAKMVVLEIEKMKAETELKNANSFALIAQSIDRFSQKFCQNPNVRHCSQCDGSQDCRHSPGANPI